MFDNLFKTSAPAKTPASGGIFSNVFGAPTQSTAQPSFLETLQQANAAPTGPGAKPSPNPEADLTPDIPASALTGPLGGGYGPSNIKDQYSGKPLLTFENPAAKSSELLSDRVAPAFDPTVPQKIDPSILHNGRMPESASEAVKKATGAPPDTQLDHLISLELGGSNDTSNLNNEDLQPNGTQPSLTQENAIAKQVASGQISYIDGQKAIARLKGVQLPDDTDFGTDHPLAINYPKPAPNQIGTQAQQPSLASKVGGFFSGLFNGAKNGAQNAKDSVLSMLAGTPVSTKDTSNDFGGSNDPRMPLTPAQQAAADKLLTNGKPTPQDSRLPIAQTIDGKNYDANGDPTSGTGIIPKVGSADPLGDIAKGATVGAVQTGVRTVMSLAEDLTGENKTLQPGDPNSGLGGSPLSQIATFGTAPIAPAGKFDAADVAAAQKGDLKAWGHLLMGGVALGTAETSGVLDFGGGEIDEETLNALANNTDHEKIVSILTNKNIDEDAARTIAPVLARASTPEQVKAVLTVAANNGLIYGVKGEGVSAADEFAAQERPPGDETNPALNTPVVTSETASPAGDKNFLQTLQDQAKPNVPPEGIEPPTKPLEPANSSIELRGQSVKPKAQFISPIIRPLTPIENMDLGKVQDVISGKSSKENIATVPGFLSSDGKDRPLVLTHDQVEGHIETSGKNPSGHGKIVPENLIVNTHDWDAALTNIKDARGENPNPDKINLLKKIPGSNNILVVGADRTNGYYTLTHYEISPKTGNEIKSLLGRGDLVSSVGGRLDPADFLSTPPAQGGSRTVLGRGDASNITPSSKPVNSQKESFLARMQKEANPTQFEKNIKENAAGATSVDDTEQAQNEAATKTVIGNGKGIKSFDGDTQALYRNWVNQKGSSNLSISGQIAAKPFEPLRKAGMDAVHAFQDGDRINPAFTDLQKANEALRAKEIKGGIEVPDRGPNYLYQTWANTPEEIQKAYEKYRGTAGGSAVSLNPGFTKEASFPDYKTGEEYGLVPKYDNIPDIMNARAQASERALADRTLFDQMAKRNLIQPSNHVGKGWETLDPDRFPRYAIRGSDGTVYHGTVKAPADLAELINNQLRGPQSGADKFFAATAKWSTKLKTIVLSSGIPGTAINLHGFNELAATVPELFNQPTLFTSALQYMFYPKAGAGFIEDNLKLAQEAARSGLILGGEDISISSLAEKALNRGIRGTLAGIFQKSQDILYSLFAKHDFEQMIPALKLKMWSDTKGFLTDQGMSEAEAGQKAAARANQTFGGLNYDAMGRDKNLQNVLRTFVFAPDFWESRFRYAGNMGKSLVGKGDMSKLYRNAALTIVGAYLAMNAANKKTSGKWMFQNPAGHSMDIYMGKDSKGKNIWFRPFGTDLDFIRLPLDIASSIMQGDLSPIGTDVRNRVGTILQPLLTLVTNSDAYGNTVFQPANTTHPLLSQVGSFASTLPVVPQIGAGLSGLFNKGQSTEQSLSEAAGLPVRFNAATTPSTSNLADMIYTERPELETQIKQDYLNGNQTDAYQKMSDFNQKLLQLTIQAYEDNGHTVTDQKAFTQFLLTHTQAEGGIKGLVVMPPSQKTMSTAQKKQGQPLFNKIFPSNISASSTE